MSAISAIEEAAAMVYMFENADKYRLNKAYSNIIIPYKGSSTKKGNNPKAIKARRKKNKIFKNMHNPKMHYTIYQILVATKGLFLTPLRMKNGCRYYMSHYCGKIIKYSNEQSKHNNQRSEV